MATLAVQQVPVGGMSPSYADATSGGDKAPTGRGRYLEVVNGSGSSINVTMTTPGTAHGVAIADPVLAVADGATGVIPLDSVYRGSDGLASIAYSSATSVTVAVLQLP